MGDRGELVRSGANVSTCLISQPSIRVKSGPRVDSLHEGQDFNLRLSRAKFEELCQRPIPRSETLSLSKRRGMDYFKKAMEPVSQRDA